MEFTNKNPKLVESSAFGDSDKGSCSEAPQIGATVQVPVEHWADKTPLKGGGGPPPPSDPSSENLEGLTEKVGTFGLRATSKKRCGAANKRARSARVAEALSGDSGGG